MTTEEQELRELDAWIGLNVMGWTRGDVKPSKWFPDGAQDAWLNPRGALDTLPEFTSDPADALAVLEKCAEKLPMYLTVAKDADGYYIDRPDEDSSAGVMAKTLPLAICQFAKKLFEG